MPSNINTVALTGANQAISAIWCTYNGFDIRETAGAAAVVRIYDNPSAASGTLLDTIGLAANESAREWYGPQGINAKTGVYVSIVSGTVEGSVRVS